MTPTAHENKRYTRPLFAHCCTGVRPPPSPERGPANVQVGATKRIGWHSVQFAFVPPTSGAKKVQEPPKSVLLTGDFNDWGRGFEMIPKGGSFGA